MTEIENKLHEIDKLNTLQQRDRWMNKLHPLVKVALSVFYIAIAISVDKYALGRMIMLALYPVVTYGIADLSIKDALYRMRLILPLVLAVGIFNPIFDRAPGMLVGGIMLSAGWISMLTLMLKGIYSVLAAYLLIATTSMEEICYALRIIRVPKTMVTVLLLTYRYIMILGEEADCIMTAYLLRAPSQKGIHYKAWGSLVGQWLLRSFDRAERIYEGMVLRGFNGEFPALRTYHASTTGILYCLAWMAALTALRFLPMFG